MKIDRRKTYYKVTSEKENHRGLQYKTGVVKDILSFNNYQEGLCCAGGMYFTTGELLPTFFSYGPNIRPIRLLKESQVILDPKGDRFRTDVFDMKDKITFKKWYGKFGDKVAREDLWSFPMYCSDSIKLWYQNIIERIPDEHLWHFLMYCQNSIKLWYQDIIDRLPNRKLWWFPRYCNDSINVWHKDVIEKIPDKHLRYFSEYCEDSKDIWEKEYNKRMEEYL